MYWPVKVLLTLTLALVLVIQPAAAAFKGGRLPRSAENAITFIRHTCDQEILAAGGPCLANQAARENCILRCASPECYQAIYGECVFWEPRLTCSPTFVAHSKGNYL